MGGDWIVLVRKFSTMGSCLARSWQTGIGLSNYHRRGLLLASRGCRHVLWPMMRVGRPECGYTRRSAADAD